MCIKKWLIFWFFVFMYACSTTSVDKNYLAAPINTGLYKKLSNYMDTISDNFVSVSLQNGLAFNSIETFKDSSGIVKPIVYIQIEGPFNSDRFKNLEEAVESYARDIKNKIDKKDAFENIIYPDFTSEITYVDLFEVGLITYKSPHEPNTQYIHAIIYAGNSMYTATTTIHQFNAGEDTVTLFFALVGVLANETCFTLDSKGKRISQCNMFPDYSTEQKTIHSQQEGKNKPEPGYPWDFIKDITTVIETPEIIRILEEEKIQIAITTHSNYIAILLEDGKSYGGTYVNSQAGKYADNQELYSACAIVGYIREKRISEEWELICE